MTALETDRNMLVAGTLHNKLEGPLISTVAHLGHSQLVLVTLT